LPEPYINIKTTYERAILSAGITADLFDEAKLDDIIREAAWVVDSLFYVKNELKTEADGGLVFAPSGKALGWPYFEMENGYCENWAGSVPGFNARLRALLGWAEASDIEVWFDDFVWHINREFFMRPNEKWVPKT
jgi:hypothetical protein